MKNAILESDAALITIREVGELCHVTVKTIDRWVKNGVLPAPVKLGGGPCAPIRFRKSDIENWLAAGCPGCKH